jgi:TonB family protein
MFSQKEIRIMRTNNVKRQATLVHVLMLFFWVCSLSCMRPQSVLAVTPTSDVLSDGERTTDPWSTNGKSQEEYKQLLSIRTHSLKLNPKNPTELNARADAYLHLKMSKEAYDDANASISLKSKDPELVEKAFCIRGQAQIQQQQYKRALDDLNKACSLDNESGEAFYFRGMAKEKLGQLAEAIKDYASARSFGYTAKGFDVDFSRFMETMQRQIKKGWFPPKGEESKRVVTVFKLARNGSMSDLRISQSSGVAAVDAAAKRAVESAFPFGRLPLGVPRHVDVEFKFDYNVFSGGDRISGVKTTAPPAGFSYLDHTTKQWNQAESDAMKEMQEAQKKNDDTALWRAQLKLADIYSDRGKYEAAIALYQGALQALKKDPAKNWDYGKALGHLAIVYSLQGKNAEAMLQFENSLYVIDKEPGYPQHEDVVRILKEYAKVLYKSNKREEANKIYARLKK